MNEIKPRFVTFKQAKLIKEKTEFDIWVSKHYCFTEPNKLRCSNVFKMPRCSPQIAPFNYKKLEGVYYAPEQWQLIEYFRVKHHIDLYSYPILLTKNNIPQERIIDEYSFQIIKKGINQFIPKEHFGYSSPQEATSAAIDFVLEKLI